MARIAITASGPDRRTEPFETLAAALAARGHDVVLVTRNPLDDRPRAFDTVALHAPDGESGDTAVLDHPPSLPGAYRAMLLPLVAEEYRTIAARVGPGALVVAHEPWAVAARLVCEQYRLPLVSAFAAPGELARARLYTELVGGALAHDVNTIRKALAMPERVDVRSWWSCPRDGVALWPGGRLGDFGWPCRDAHPAGPEGSDPAAAVETVRRRRSRRAGWAA